MNTSDHILIVDDDRDIRQLLADYLEKQGLRCTTAADGREMKAARYLNWRINRQVNAEDTALIARVQAGMESSSYSPGPLGESEVCLRSFARKLRRLLPEARHDTKPAGYGSAR